MSVVEVGLGPRSQNISNVMELDVEMSKGPEEQSHVFRLDFFIVRLHTLSDFTDYFNSRKSQSG